MHWLFALVAQVSPDASSQWVPPIISGVGGAGLSTALLWKIHAEDRKTISQLTSRLFLLADRATEVGKTAAEVVQNEANDPVLLAEMQRLIALIEERSR